MYVCGCLLALDLCVRVSCLKLDGAVNLDLVVGVGDGGEMLMAGVDCWKFRVAEM